MQRIHSEMKPGRNDPCICGSGKKYKKCCGQELSNTSIPEPSTRGIDPVELAAASEPAPTLRPVASAQIGELIALVRAGRHPESENLARELLAHNPNSGLIWKILALSLWLQGKDALQALTQATILLPDDAEAHSNLGNALRAAHRLDDAVSSHKRALAIKPDYAEAHNNLGTALRDLGRLEEAAASYRAAIAAKHDFATAHGNLGRLLAQLGRLDEAAQYLRRAANSDPDSAEAHVNLGRVLLRLGRLEDARASGTRAVALAPASAEAHGFLGDARRALWELDGAAKSYEQALALKPDYAEVYNNLGNTLFFLGRHDDAAASCRRALEISPGLAEVHSNLGMILMLQNRMREAEASCARALEIDPGLTGALVLLGELRANEGRFAEAEELLKHAISLEPDMPEAWAGLVRWRKVTQVDEAWLNSAQRIVAQPLAPRREVHLRYALGKYFDDLKEYTQAFAHYRRANELTKQHNAKYDRQELNRYIDLIVDFYDKDWIRQASVATMRSERPVFIVGMWRSGTTLTEQILASHPDVFGAGELPYWKSAAAAYERSLLDVDAHANPIGELAAGYLAQLHDLSPVAARVVDKMSSNFLHLGLIHAALPQARIIHLRRNPIDTCLSIYFQDFHSAHLYANDLDDLAHYYAQYVRVMLHWQQTLPAGAILEVCYEDLVADQETWTRKIVEFIGLPWNERCLDFHRTSRPVATVSKWQVRQTLNNSSVARWRNYANFVGPLMRLETEEPLGR